MYFHDVSRLPLLSSSAHTPVYHEAVSETPYDNPTPSKVVYLNRGIVNHGKKAVHYSVEKI